MRTKQDKNSNHGDLSQKQKQNIAMVTFKNTSLSRLADSADVLIVISSIFDEEAGKKLVF